jgi:Trypsin-co-occurring domain 1
MANAILVRWNKKTSIWIETADDVEMEGALESPVRPANILGAEKSLASFEKLSQTILACCQSAIESMKRIAKEHRPDKATVEFGIKVSAEGHFIVSKGSTEATLKITAEWKLDHELGAR